VLRYAQWREAPVGEYLRPDGIHADAAHALLTERFGERFTETARRGPAAPAIAPHGPGTTAVAPHGAGPTGVAGDGATDGATDWRAEDDRVVLDDETATELLAHYGIRVVPFRLVDSLEAARSAAEELGFPVALKGVEERWQGPELVGIRLDLDSPGAVARAYRELVDVTERAEMYVQRMAPKGPSCVLRVLDDPSFGSLLSFGLSGITTELLGDRAHRVIPLSTRDAHELIRAPRAAPLLSGYGGAPAADLAALEDLALRLSCLAEDLPEVRSLRLGPVLAAPHAASVTAARVELGPPPNWRDTGPRRLA
jgi:hypothetical protein